MNKLSLKDLIFQSLIGASYVVLVFVLYNFSYKALQFRVAESLLVLVFFNKKNAIGLLIGTFVANFLGDFGIIDAIFGTLTTFIVISFMLTLKKIKILSLLMPVIFNGLYVAILVTVFSMTSQDTFLTLLLAMGPLIFLTVAAGEAVVVYGIGLPLYYMLNKNDGFKAIFEK
ncbi:MAG: QueT transporter family protein [Acholeplasmataceae bacterium]